MPTFRFLSLALLLSLPGCLEPTTGPANDAGVALDDAGSDDAAAPLDPDAGRAGDPDAGTPDVDAGVEPAEDAGLPPFACDVDDLRFEGTYADAAPMRETGSLRIHFGSYSTDRETGPCDALGGAAWPNGWWGQEARHGRTAVVQARQHGSAICASVATAAYDLVYTGTISADCASMSGAFEGTMDDGTVHRGTWSAALVRE